MLADVRFERGLVLTPIARPEEDFPGGLFAAGRCQRSNGTILPPAAKTLESACEEIDLL